MVFIRSAAGTTLVRRIPYLSLTRTISPWATTVLFTSRSRGSPANLSSSTTLPWDSLRRSRIFKEVFPTSTEIVTGIP